MLDWRLTQVEIRVSDLEERPSLPSLAEGFPWRQAVLLLLLLVAGLKGLIAPETALALAGKVLGIVWPH